MTTVDRVVINVQLFFQLVQPAPDVVCYPLRLCYLRLSIQQHLIQISFFFLYLLTLDVQNARVTFQHCTKQNSIEIITKKNKDQAPSKVFSVW